MAEYTQSVGIEFNSLDKFILELNENTGKVNLYNTIEEINLIPDIDIEAVSINNTTSTARSISAICEDVDSEKFALKITSVSAGKGYKRIGNVLMFSNCIYIIMTSAVYSAASFVNMELEDTQDFPSTYKLYKFRVDPSASDMPTINFN